MFWVIIAILAIIIGLLEDLAPFILILIVAGIIYMCYQSIKTKLQEKEAERIRIITKEVDEFVKAKMPKVSVTLETPDRVQVSTDEINKDILFIVKKYQEAIKQHVVAKKACDAQLKRLLGCDHLTDVDAKKHYLDEHKDVIGELKEESDRLFSLIYERKVQLFNKGNILVTDFNRAVLALKNSKKCTCDTVDVKDFLCEDKPLELSMFSYVNSPVSFRISGFYYCVFDDVILVFDKKGCFSSALDPSALKISVKRKHAATKWHDNIADDSRAITFKETRNNWSYNNSGFEYGTVTLCIGKTQTTFTVSSSLALDAWEQVAPKFKKKCNTTHDPIPSFLLLINKLYHHSISEKMMSIYEDTAQHRNKFCGIK